MRRPRRGLLVRELKEGGAVGMLMFLSGRILLKGDNITLMMNTGV